MMSMLLAADWSVWYFVLLRRGACTVTAEVKNLSSKIVQQQVCRNIPAITKPVQTSTLICSRLKHFKNLG